MKMDLNISSAPYLANEQGLNLLRDATAAVYVALKKINDLKKYVKLQRTMKLNNISLATPVTLNKTVKSEPCDKEIDVISIDDDSDVEELSREIARSKTISFLNSNGYRGASAQDNFARSFENRENQNLPTGNATRLNTNQNIQDNYVETNNSNAYDNSLSSIIDNQAGNSCSTLEEAPPKLQVYFTIVHNSVTEFDVEEVLTKEGFKDFSVIVKNKEYHSYGFIKFSNEESAKRAIKMSFKILISGQSMKILPYNGNSAVKRNSTKNAEHCQSLDDNNSKKSVHSIEENILINISCGYERNRVKETFNPRYEDEMNGGGETNSCWYTDPHYAQNKTPENPRIQISSPPYSNQINLLEQQTAPFHDNSNSFFPDNYGRPNYEIINSTPNAIINHHDVDHNVKETYNNKKKSNYNKTNLKKIIKAKRQEKNKINCHKNFNGPRSSHTPHCNKKKLEKSRRK